jgi:hypothetical protein
MFNPNKNFQQQQNQAQQQQFQNAFNQANKLQQAQFQNFINQSRNRFKKNVDKQMEDARRHGVAAGIAAAEASRRRRLQSAEPVQLPRFGQADIKRTSSWKKSIGVMILIATAVLTLGAVLQTHSSPAKPAGTPGVISVGANIRAGPGTGNSVTAIVPEGTRITISCRIATPAGKWDKLSSPYQGLFVSATLVHSHRPPRC